MQNQLTFLWEEPPARASQSQDSERDLKTPEETSCSHILQWLIDLSPSGLSGKMSPVSCHLTEEKILEPSSQRWGKSGMGGPTESWTLNTSEFHKDADVCLLSDVLEIGEVQEKFYLSPKALAWLRLREPKRLPRVLQLHPGGDTTMATSSSQKADALAGLRP